MRTTETMSVTKYIETGNTGVVTVTYTVSSTEFECGLDFLSYEQLKALADFLHEYVQTEKGGAR